MNEEMILRNYLFRFLRSPDYKTDVNFYLPKFLTNDPAFSETQRVLSWEHERYRLKVIDFAKQFHPQTATWGLNVWEEELGLPTDLSLDLELRRAKVMAKLLGASPMTVANTNTLINLFTDDGKAYVDELPEDGTLKIIIPSKNAYIDEMRESLDEMLPAHLVYDFRHIIEIGDDDEESGGSGKPDSVEDINDEDSTADIDGSAFFIHADFPILENVPCGSWYNAPKYDGSVIAKVANMIDGSMQYDGQQLYKGVNSETTQVGKYCRWWFIPKGKSSFNKEFQHNGAIRYDGLRPQDIEYDDGMDELESVEIVQAIEEKFVGVDQYDGTSTFNGAVSADETELPTDNGGNVEIKRFRVFDGAVQYDGGDMNYFNGAIRADGKFNFAGNGTRAQVEVLTDSIDGELSNVRPEKETALSEYYPEMFDFVPVITDEHSAEILTATVDDTVNGVSDDCNAMMISRAVRYDGAKDYSGGNLNYFDGSIKADGKFSFEGSGNQAKVEVIAVDLDGTFELSEHTKKEIPPFVYVENFDFVSEVRDETSFTAQTDFEDSAEPNDGNGGLTIIRRSRFDGNLSYQGNFEYPANATRRFDGGLNYNGVYRVSADGISQFNGTERYGGRKNHNFIEYVTDLDGNIQIVDVSSLERIPIATREKLGFVIAGANLDINDRGEIKLLDRLKIQKMTEIQAGILPALFENRRGKNEI